MASKKNSGKSVTRVKLSSSEEIRLWVQAGGRCEFPSCNKYLLEDELTQQEDNFAHKAHIVAYNARGPRGSESDSPRLVTDLANLMLLCPVHSKLIDGANRNGYTVEALTENKKGHEERVLYATSLHDDQRSRVLMLSAKVGDRTVRINTGQVRKAMLPYWPEARHIDMDFINMDGRGRKGHWLELAKRIKGIWNQECDKGYGSGPPDHLSIFAFAPIPLLIQLGNVTGTHIPCRIFQKQRQSDDWSWLVSEGKETVEFTLKRPRGSTKKSTEVALLLSLSGDVQRDKIAAMIPGVPIYEIRPKTKPDLELVRTEDDLRTFRSMYRTLIGELRSLVGHHGTIHLFPAIPQAIAVACGQDLLPKVDPKLKIYDFDKASGGYVATLTIN